VPPSCRQAPSRRRSTADPGRNTARPWRIRPIRYERFAAVDRVDVAGTWPHSVGRRFHRAHGGLYRASCVRKNALMTNEESVDLDDLARRAAAGDQTALNQLLTAVQPRAMRLCRRILPVPQDAEEACQDVLMKIATKIGSYEGRSKFTTWMHVV